MKLGYYKAVYISSTAALVPNDFNLTMGLIAQSVNCVPSSRSEPAKLAVPDDTDGGGVYI